MTFIVCIALLTAGCDLLYEEPEYTMQEIGQRFLRDVVSSKSLYQRNNVPLLDALVYYEPRPTFSSATNDTLRLNVIWDVVDSRGPQQISRIDITMDGRFTSSPSPTGRTFVLAPYYVDPRQWRITFDKDVDTVGFVFYDSTVTNGSADYFGYGFTDSTLKLSKSNPHLLTFRGQTEDSIVVFTAWGVDTGWVRARWIVPDTGSFALPDSVIKQYTVGRTYALYARRAYFTVTKSRHGRTIGHVQPMEHRLFFTITD